jgi:hypothetical protein
VLNSTPLRFKKKNEFVIRKGFRIGFHGISRRRA